MKLLVSLNNIRAALAFSDYLNANGIPNQLKQSSGEAHIYIVNDADEVPARDEARRFEENPTDPRYLEASWQQERSDNITESVDGYYQKKNSGLKHFLARSGVFTKCISAICLVIFVLSSLGRDIDVLEYFFFFKNTDAMQGKEIWRWISPVLIHLGFVHIAFNLLWWWDLGGIIERFQSTRRLILLFFILGVVSNTSQFLVSGNQFGGMSGIVYGVLGYLWFYGRMRPDSPLQINPAIVAMMLIWLVLCFTGLLGPIANAAHLSGLLCGSFLAIVLAQWDKSIAFRRRS